VNTYSWSSGSPATSNPTVSATNNAGSTSTGNPTITLTADTTAPSGGSVTYTDGYTSGLSAAITLATGTDAGSGIATATTALQRKTAPLSSGTCGTYSSFSTIATNPGASYTDTALAAQTCYKYQYVVTDNVGNSTTYTSANTVEVDYSHAVLGTAGIVSFWRMGANSTSTDSFTDADGTSINSHNDDNNNSWTHLALGLNGTITVGSNRIHRSHAGQADYINTVTPSSANYAVEADVTDLSTPSDDYICVTGRGHATSAYKSYQMCYHDASARWELIYSDGSGYTAIAASNQTLTVGQTYHIRLDMNGTSLTGWVDGVKRLIASDSNIAAADYAGISVGAGAANSVPTASAGWQMDNWRVVPNTGSTFADSQGTNTGTFSGAPLLNPPGAINGDPNSATEWTASTSYGSVPDANSLDLGDGPLSLEAWVKRNDNGTGMQTILQKGTNAYQFGFYNNKIGLYKYTGSGVGTIIAQSSGTQTDMTAYHHYVATKTGSTVHIYVDGADVTGTVTNQTLSNTASALVIGGGNASEFLNAYLDDVAVYNQVLSSTNVSDHYTIGH
jgi:hypothetical protein